MSALIDWGPSPLVYAATDGRHRPPSHPLIRDMAAREVPPRADYYAHIGRAIREQRERRGWSQRRMGALYGVTGVTVCHWEKGQVKPDAWTIDRLEQMFGTRLRP